MSQHNVETSAGDDGVIPNIQSNEGYEEESICVKNEATNDENVQEESITSELRGNTQQIDGQGSPNKIESHEESAQSTSVVETTKISTKPTDADAGMKQKQTGQEDLLSGADVEVKAVLKILEEQGNIREDDLKLQVENISQDDIPVVQPIYLQVAFYQGECALQDGKYKPSMVKRELGENKEVKFEEILLHRGKNNFIGLIGYPGSGKSTCSKRLAKSTKFVCFHRKFFDMNYPDKLTLRELLLDKAYPDLGKATYENAFKWILENEEKCAFIFDGLDQAEWELDDKTAKESYETPQSVQKLVTDLCKGRFLRKSLLIFTSRPHSLATVQKDARPETTIFLSDLSHDDAKKLFCAHAGTNDDDLWNELETSAPQLISLAYNPLMCQLVAAAFTNPSDEIGEILTMTRVFATVLKNLRHSDNARNEDIHQLKEKISRLAYNATINSTVVISHDQLTKEGLDPNRVQDVIILLHAHKGVTGKIFEGDMKFYFAHQSFQEYYSASHIKDQMPVEEFQSFVKEKLFTDHFQVVRRFLLGQLVDLERDDQTDSDVMDSIAHFVEEPLQVSKKSFPKMISDPFRKLRNLFYRKKQSKPDHSTNQETSQLETDHSEELIMFSYNWDDSQKVAFKISDGLRAEGYPIWIDTEQMHGNIYERMADAVENATVILMCMSPKYEISKNCDREASYAQKLGKRIIPIFTQKNYEPKGLCGLIAAGKLYFDFCDERSFHVKLNELIREIKQPQPSHSTNQDASQPSTSKQLQNQQSKESASTLEVSTKQPISSQAQDSNVHHTSDNSPSNKNNEDIQKKRKILMKSLILNLKRFSSKVGIADDVGDWKADVYLAERREIFSLWSDVFECRNSMLTRQAARLFPTDADLSGIPINDQMLHTLCDVIPQVTKYIERLDFQGCQMNKKQTHRLLEVIISNSITIGILVISYNPVDIRDIKALLPKVRKCLGIMSCFTDDEGRWRDANQDERNEIQDALNNLDNWELGVEVGVDDETKTFIKLTKQK